ncbi:uncharacterized protein LOC115223102 [Octopus sinensis]|uniref:Uncharacterized protein LOC115223102 n=1 Tax=Octopus sinensis TaxID=2607531 RepID=A0A7E6FJT4_9MOLL|nr:uncharacterized protein LOC115223102 [Octopus sinensis]
MAPAKKTCRQYSINYLSYGFIASLQNCQLSMKAKTLVDCKSFITVFISKSVLYKINISKRRLHQFPQLDSLKDELVDEDIVTYRDYPQSLHDGMMERFQDVITLNIPNWLSKPFEVQAVHCEELIELRNDYGATMRYRFHGKEGLWCRQSILNSYTNPWKHLKLMLAFPTSYKVESGLSLKAEADWMEPNEETCH